MTEEEANFYTNVNVTIAKLIELAESKTHSKTATNITTGLLFYRNNELGRDFEIQLRIEWGKGGFIGPEDYIDGKITGVTESDFTDMEAVNNVNKRVLDQIEQLIVKP